MTTLDHGYAKNGKRCSTYMIWQQMRSRCLSKTNKNWNRYGGRGITVCDRWKSFANFLADMGERPAGLTLERNDNDGPYAPWNCCWATRKMQQRNSTNAVLITHYGQTLCVKEWAEVLDIPVGRIRYRIKAGWPIERALRP